MTINVKSPELSRRSVLAGLGGLSFGLAIGTDGLKLIGDAQANTPAAGQQYNNWVRIAPNGTVTIISAGSEMGQGTSTTLPMIVAEEMDADWSKVVIEMTWGDPTLHGYTFQNNKMMAIVGSRGTMLYFNDLRIAGAQVRKVLMQNAAEKWGVDVASLKTEPGFVVNPANGQKLSYGEIAAFAKVPSPLPAVDPKELKARKDWRLIGKGVPRRDTPSKANGTAVYGIDVKLPGMVYATSMHAPVHTGTLESFNEADIRKMPGVIATVRLPNGVAVVAEHFEQAKAARDAIKATWKDGAAAGFDSAQGARRLRQAAPRSEGADHQPVEEGRRRRGLCGRGEEVQRRLSQRLRLSRADGAAERGGARGGRRPVGRGLGGHAGGRRHPRRGGEGARHRARQGEGDPVLHGRRLRPALARRLRRRMRAASPRRSAVR